MKLPPGAGQRLALPGIVAAALIAGGAPLSYHAALVQKAAGEQQTAATERQSAQQKLARATDEEREIRETLVDYHKLLARGVIGEEQRLDWVDRIGEIKAARKLFDVKYSIDPQRPVDYPGIGGAGDVEFLASPMKLEISLLHEEDLFRFLDDLRGALSAHVVVRSCTFTRGADRVERGMTAAARELRHRSGDDPRPQDEARMSTTMSGRKCPPFAPRGRCSPPGSSPAPPAPAPPRPTTSAGCFSRRSSARSSTAGARATSGKRPGVIESSVTVNGHVAQSSGKTTTWINGVPQYDTHSGRDPARVHLEDGTLKIGQTLDRARGEVKDGLKGGTVRVNRTAPR